MIHIISYPWQLAHWKKLKRKSKPHRYRMMGAQTEIASWGLGGLDATKNTKKAKPVVNINCIKLMHNLWLFYANTSPGRLEINLPHKTKKKKATRTSKTGKGLLREGNSNRNVGAGSMEEAHVCVGGYRSNGCYSVKMNALFCFLLFVFPPTMRWIDRNVWFDDCKLACSK